MGTRLNLLLVEDNQTIAKQLCEFFEGHQWVVDYASNGEQGLALALNNSYNVILLDINLPGMDGFEVCRQLRELATQTIPVLMLTARDAFEDKAKGFGCGADDYVIKPFEFRELALRCQALARRQQLFQQQLLKLGDLEIDSKMHQVHRAGQVVELTRIGFQILKILAQASPQPVSRSDLLHQIWGNDPPDTDSLRQHIYSLRNAVDKPYEFKMLKTITNIGYQLVVDE